jgi:DNA-binding CsgD family transcriptional regulator
VTSDMTSETELIVGSAGPASLPDSGDRCPACGSALPSAGPDVAAMIIRATISQPVAAALRSTHLLSVRERTVFQLLGVGYDNRSISRELSVSERTVKRHVTAILAKLKLESRLQAGLAALIISSAPSHAAPWPADCLDGAHVPDHAC